MSDSGRTEIQLTNEEAYDIDRRLTFHFIKNEETRKREIEDTNIILKALNMSMDALDKQIPKKPEIDEIWNVVFCSCGQAVSKPMRFCHCCGQKIDWSGTHENHNNNH